MRIKDLFGLLGLSSGAVTSHNSDRSNGAQSARSSTEQDVLTSSSACTTSRIGRYDLVRGRNAAISFSTDPIDDDGFGFEMPFVEPLNATTGEQWEFDGISEDGSAGIMIGFYRDPAFSFLGTGNLRFYVELAFANGSRYAVVDYAEESTLESCPPGRGTRGTWRGTGWTYSFEVAADMSWTRIVMDAPDIKGTVVMRSLAPPRYADNAVWPSTDASSGTVPFFHWVEPVPVADLAIDAEIAGEKVAWTGMGGHERLWSAFSWYTCVDSMTAVRLRAGSFALSFVEFGSNFEAGLLVPSLFLAENGEKVFGARRTDPSETEDYMQVRKLYGGKGVSTRALADKATGFELVLESPSRHKRWLFTVTHKNILFELGFGESVGTTGYTGIVEGGLDKSERCKGPAYTEIMKFPQRSLLLTKNYVS